jgi:outer membrane protein assembly factor BamD (BamD/ComL family)
VAEHYERRGKYEAAYQQWSEIRSRWPIGELGRDALLAMARTKHAAYGGPSFDDSDLISAQSFYESFRLRYPERAEELNITDRLERIKEQRAYKQYHIAKYYASKGDVRSAGFYYRMVVDNWPESNAAEMAREEMAVQRPAKEFIWHRRLVEKLDDWWL